MEDSKKPLIILIGGASGTGKTTIARELSIKLNVSHRLGTGFIREIARYYLAKSNHPELFNFSFRPPLGMSPFSNLLEQAELIKGAIHLCIQRAFNEGTSLIIEGTHLVPGIIEITYVSLFVILIQPEIKRHKEMFIGSTHTRRLVTNQDFKINRDIQDELKTVANKHNIPLIKVTEKFETINVIKNLLNK